MTNVKSAPVVLIDFYEAGKLPFNLDKEAKAKGFHAKKKIIAVKTHISSPPTYEFQDVGTTPDEIIEFMHRVAREDGTDLNVAVKQAFAD